MNRHYLKRTNVAASLREAQPDRCSLHRCHAGRTAGHCHSGTLPPSSAATPQRAGSGSIAQRPAGLRQAADGSRSRSRPGKISPAPLAPRRETHSLKSLAPLAPRRGECTLNTPAPLAPRRGEGLGVRGSARRAFTLVEILTVIVIIGILAAIAVPAINGALKAAKTAAIRAEIDVLGQALEAYKLEYGEYPPDFYSWDQVERHFRKAFPDIEDDELRILAQFTHYRASGSNKQRCNPPVNQADPRSMGANMDHYPHAIDRAEALVFCLGGFSSDKNRPFTGAGGPLAPITGGVVYDPTNPTSLDFAAFQYNTDRENGFFEFDTEQLSLRQYTDSAPVFTYSDDEVEVLSTPTEIYNSVDGNALNLVYYADPFPTYRPPSSDLPIVYFNAQNYNRAWGYDASGLAWYNAAADSAHTQNLYLPVGDVEETGIARPYASDVVDTTPPSSIIGITLSNPPPILEFAQANRFQLISAGLDSNYGGIANAGFGSGATGINIFPTGGYYNPFIDTTSTSPSSTTKYQDDLELGTQTYNAQPQLDNITNFSTSDLESDLP